MFFPLLLLSLLLEAPGVNSKAVITMTVALFGILLGLIEVEIVLLRWLQRNLARELELVERVLERVL